jgi:hypothetical protein
MKTDIVRSTILALLAAVVAGVSALGATGDVELPQSAEVIKVLKSHYVDRDKLDKKLLDDATIAGILEALGDGVMIITPDATGSNAAQVVEAAGHSADPVARAEVIDPDIAYIRIADVVDETVVALDTELKKFADKKIGGLVLDLRFADGTNYAAAAVVACRFVGEGHRLFGLKSGAAELKEFTSGVCPAELAGGQKQLTEIPLVVLVNRQTRGSAEVLAGALHAQQRAILVGSATAGSAAAWEDMKLADGRVLRLATAKIVLPAEPGEEASLTVDVVPGGVTPDVPVKIDPKVELDVVLNVQTNMTLTASLQPLELKKRIGEAELVKAFRGEAVDLKLSVPTNISTAPKIFNGEMFDSGTEATNATTSGSSAAAGSGEAARESEKAAAAEPVRDTVLQHAVDILKGIRVLLSSR